VLAIATSARTLRAQAAAAAALPMMALCGYLTFSRGGAIEATAALLVFMALAPDRIPKLATLLVAAAGSAALIAGAVHRSAVERGLTNAAAHHEGASLLIATDPRLRWGRASHRRGSGSQRDTPFRRGCSRSHANAPDGSRSARLR
jgi:hypothetical protein